jgi:hypothetical protein
MIIDVGRIPARMWDNNSTCRGNRLASWRKSNLHSKQIFLFVACRCMTPRWRSDDVKQEWKYSKMKMMIWNVGHVELSAVKFFKRRQANACRTCRITECNWQTYMPTKMDTAEAISEWFQSFKYQSISAQNIEEKIDHKQKRVHSEHCQEVFNAVFWLILVRQKTENNWLQPITARSRPITHLALSHQSYRRETWSKFGFNTPDLVVSDHRSMTKVANNFSSSNYCLGTSFNWRRTDNWHRQ